MKPTEVLRLMIQRSGKSALSVGRALGHAQSWAHMTIKTGRDPKLSTVAEVASATGHEVAIVDAESGEVIVTVDAPERSPEEESKAGEDA